MPSSMPSSLPHTTAPRLRLNALALLIIFISPLLQAHTVEQLFLSLEKPEKQWQLKATFDAAYALPEFRNDESMPQPKRQWLLDLSQAEHQRLRQEAESYLRESLSFSHAGQTVDFQVSFPDYQKSPPSFPVLLNGGAYFTVNLEGQLTGSAEGAFQIHVASGERPDFVIASGSKNQRNYQVASPDSQTTLFTTQEATAIVTPVSANDFNLLMIGYHHVIPMGLDHLLFILALFLLNRKWRPLLSQSLTFTLAHSITLGLAATGAIAIHHGFLGPWIEPLIALSIVMVALENLFYRSHSPRRIAIIFLFGLIHGLGFAGSLATSLDLTNQHWFKPLALANIGVELAQITILALAWLLTMRWWKSPLYEKFRILLSLAIATVGGYWLIERLLSA